MYLKCILIGLLVSLLSACGNQQMKPQETAVLKSHTIDHEKALEEAMVEVDMTEFGFRGY